MGNLMRESARWLQWAMVRSSPSGAHCARTKVENYILGKGEWPFPHRDDYAEAEMHIYRLDLLKSEDDSWRFGEDFKLTKSCDIQ
jgi:hypothetical protein